jgi:hypothetical protein
MGPIAAGAGIPTIPVWPPRKLVHCPAIWAIIADKQSVIIAKKSPLVLKMGMKIKVVMAIVIRAPRGRATQ